MDGIVPPQAVHGGAGAYADTGALEEAGLLEDFGDFLPGSDAGGAADHSPHGFLDFSANTNPLGMSPMAIAAAREALPRCDRYPDRTCAKLREAICAAKGDSCAAVGLTPAMVCCGAGASDLIYRIARALRCLCGSRPFGALVLSPTFSEYERALTLEGCSVSRYQLDASRDFALDEGILDAIDESLGAVFLCEPNNPTGLVSSPDLLERVLDRCEHAGVMLVVDECFLDFLEPAEQIRSLARLVPEHPGLVVLGAHTKFYGMAGLRLGYAICSDLGFVDLIERAGEPWPVSTVAQAAGIAALQDIDFARRTRLLVRTQRAVLKAGLEEMGLRVIDGKANYLLFRCDAGDLASRMRKRGVLVRDCADFVGLGREWIRVAVRTSQENERLLMALRSSLGLQDEFGAHACPGCR